ncbi:response regulator transcription factor [Streptomyces sp. SID12501]|uniref:Response regulator transcription factor n=1 Tax=Streptomyces sp. SID12501 TaxID=2706042 RepID=A0A6B3BKT2_9ACTN|nr:response regulator transcription factor [Streptomyces sp. SID12501]NEC84542.1 response regulator transcription factor [Streptomyces sp. SID12501]
MNGLSKAGICEKPAQVQGCGQHVLVIVGDPVIAELLSTTLESAGYLVSTACSGAEALTRLGGFRFDLVVLDLALADLDVLARRHRVTGERPAVLFLAAPDSLGALLSAMGPVGRDYVTTPFRIAEVLVRVQVLLRDWDPARQPRALSYGELALDDATCEARRGPRPLDLTPAEYRLLRHLLVNSGKVLSKEQIARHVWGEYRGGNAIEQLVSRLRRKVNQETPALIHTRRGFGYWLGATAS